MDSSYWALPNKSTARNRILHSLARGVVSPKIGEGAMKINRLQQYSICMGLGAARQRSVPLRPDQVGDLGSVTDLKATCSLLRNPIALGHAPVQPQMFEPGVRHKGLDEATLIGRVLENAPVVCAVAAARARVLTEHM